LQVLTPPRGREYPAPVAGRLMVEKLAGETLVYDTASDEAHCLDPMAAAEFESAPDDVSRREVLRKLALVGAAAAGAAPLIKTIAAPTPAQAQSPTSCAGAPGTTCPAGTTCCVGMTAICCAAGTTCCQFLNLSAGFILTDCCTATEVCNPMGLGCVASSDRNLKHHLAPVGPQDVLAALGLWLRRVF
jgi:hypothetical protein